MDLATELRAVLAKRGLTLNSARLAAGVAGTAVYRRLHAAERGTLDARGFRALLGMVPELTGDERARLVAAFVGE